MASGNRTSVYGNWEFDKGDVNLDYCDVGLGLKIPWQQQPQSQQEQRQQQHHHQQQQQHCVVPWLQTRQNHNHTEDNRSPSPTISGFSSVSRFGDGGRVTFTAIQRQELERQTIIYKYMMAAMPVPPELLIPLSKYPSISTSTITTTSSPSVGRKAGVEMRYAGAGRGGGGDPEPWRCRRTDGKKWRCSRDVAPEQKYCERHSHKGRPSRSRKPVESTTSAATLPVTTTPSVSSCNPIIFTPFSIPKPSSHSFDLPSPTQFNSFPRYPDWFTKKEVAPTTTACLYPQQIGGVDTTRTSSIVEDHNQSCLLPRPFIDAWSLGDHGDPKDGSNSIDNTNNCPTPSSPLNSILPLTLSMSAGVDHDHDNSEDNTKDHPEIRLSSSSHHHQPLNWMNSWIGSPAAPGGPLAEALCLGISGSGNGRKVSHLDELVSPHGHSTSSSTTTLG
ncbi:growth-regulating factor 2-like [Chenopodium quinoa]|nr:growth-regulating factor 2-like [Chenopodium quinoa]